MTRAPVRRLAVVAFAITLFGLVVSQELAPGVDRQALFVLLGATVVGELIGLRRPDGVESRLSVAGIVALVTLGFPAAIALTAAFGAVAMRRIRAWAGDQEGMEPIEAWARIGLAGVLAGVASLIAVLPIAGHLEVATAPSSWQVPIAMIAALPLITVLGEPALRTVVRAPRSAARFRARLRQSWQADAVAAASGLLIALAYPVLRHWVLLVIALPLLAAKVGLDRHAEISLAYRQTLRAMSRLPEELGAVASGHGVRAGQLAKLAGQRVGLEPTVIRDLEYAAELHELGAIHAESAAHSEPELLGRAGADVIDEAGAQLAPVASLVESRWRPRETLRGAPPAQQLLVLSCELSHRFEDPDRPGSFTLWARAQSADPELIEAIVGAAELLGWPPVSFGRAAATAAAT